MPDPVIAQLPSVAVQAALERLDRQQLMRLLAAGEEVLECWRVLRKAGLNVVGELLRGPRGFVELEHYPDDDVFDVETNSQYYYHAHRGLSGENGHFHTFVRQPGMPPDMRPVAARASEPWPTGDAALSHLVAISMDAWGYPIGLFTTNRWVTDEAWYAAADVTRLLERFRIDHAGPSWPANRWISAMFVLFQPQMALLLEERDRQVALWAQAHTGQDVFEDRALEVTSWLPISVEVQLDFVRHRLS